MKAALHVLCAKGRTPKPERQVGAWQSFVTTPFSKIREVLGIAAAQTTVPSQQHKQTLEQAAMLISDFNKEVINFMTTDWASFKTHMKSNDLKWD